MRSGRGKCPQCKEMIVVDLDAEELRCPFCNALLKKSAKPVAKAPEKVEPAPAEPIAPTPEVEVPAEVPAEKVESTPVETPVETPAPEAVETVAEETPTEDTPAEEPPVEEALAEEAPVEEAATEESVDEIGISDEELAAMDEAPAMEEDAVTEETPKEEGADEIGISAEELAAMDEGIDESLISDEALTESEAAPAEENEPMVFGSIGADPDEEETPEEKAEGTADEADEETPDEEAPLDGNVYIEETGDESVPALTEESLASEPSTDTSEDGESEETPAEESEETPTEEVVAPEEVPEEEVVAPEEEVEIPPEAPVEEEEVPEEAPAAEEPEKSDGADADTYVPTEEDMAFAASLFETGRGYVAPTSDGAKTAKSAERGFKKVASAEGEKTMKDRETIYKKPIAVIMFILSVLASVFFFLYYKREVLGVFSADIMKTLGEKLPTFGGEYFAQYVVLIFCGLIGLIAVLAFTGKKGKLGAFFILLADIIFGVLKLWTMHGGKPYFFTFDKMPELLESYGTYASYAVYGLVLLGAIFYAISIASGSGDYEISGATCILPLIYLGVVVLGYLALVLLPKFIEFTVTTEIVTYAIYGVLGLPLLLTLIGVHSKTLSRGANAWLLFATLAAVAALFALNVVLDLIGKEKALVLYPAVFNCASPIIALIGVAGFTVADMRN